MTTASLILNPFIALGRGIFAAVGYFYGILAFIGHTFVEMIGNVFTGRRLRFASIVRHIYETGFLALPIIFLLSLGVTMVLFYQGANQLQKYGADVFTINMTVISLLREMGVLITAIMVAGRSGSAFASELGVMKLRGEIDVLRSMGLQPIEILVVPRLIALCLTLPLLTFFADIVGLLGAYVMGIWQLDLSWSQYVSRLQGIITFDMFLVGMIKAPVFAFLIAMICTHQGLSVDGSAEKVGQATTRAVVLSIFAVIMADALFSLFFAWAGI